MQSERHLGLCVAIILAHSQRGSLDHRPLNMVVGLVKDVWHALILIKLQAIISLGIKNLRSPMRYTVPQFESSIMQHVHAV